jgi:hypothetical protein
MPVFGEQYATPGIRSADTTLESAIGFGKIEQLIQSQIVIDGAARYNDGSTDQVVLPAGLLLGGPVSGKVRQWDPTNTAGYQKLHSILLYDQRMTDASGSNLDRTAAPVVVGGPVKPSGLYASGYAKGLNGRAVELIARAAFTHTGRFLLDDELYGSAFGGWAGLPIAKTADYTVLEADNNLIFTNLAATDRVRFTLPAVAMGYRFGFYEMAGVGLDIVAASGTPLVADGDATRDEVSVPPEIGTFVEVLGISATRYIVKISRGGVGAGGAGSLASSRFRLRWTAGQRGKPSLNADILNATESTRMIADPDFEVLGTNMTSALSTFNAEGGITLTTAGADGDQAILAPHLDANQSAWTQVTWGTDQEVVWEGKLKTGANITNAIIWAGLKLTNTSVVATDADSVFFRYEDDVNSGKIQTNFSIGGADTTADSGVTLVINTEYHFKITIDAGRVARMYINGELITTSTALTDAVDFIPYMAVEADGAAAAKAITVRGQEIGRNAA